MAAQCNLAGVLVSYRIEAMITAPPALRRALALLPALAIACSPARGPVPPSPDREIGARLAAAFNAHDGDQLRALFTDDARVVLIGDADPVAPARGLAALVARFPDARLAVGRTWSGATATVVELVFRGTSSAGPVLGRMAPARPVAVASAAVLALGPTGQIAALRLYVDVATALGQIDPALLPAGIEPHPFDGEPAAATFLARGSAAEAHRLALANAIWDALEAHDAARVMAGARADYRYLDFAAPHVLDKAETQQMVGRFVAAVPDFRIAAKPVQIAAGDYVVTEMVEQATLAGAPITLHALDVKQFDHELVIAEWQYSNGVEILSLVRGMAPPRLTARID
jgi:hypothetical protein